MKQFLHNVISQRCPQASKHIIDYIITFVGKIKKPYHKQQKKIKYKNPFKKHKTKYNYFYN